MIVLAFFLSFAAWTALAFAMNRHRRDMGWVRATSTQRAILRVAGGGLLAASLWACAGQWGWSMGTVAWFGVMTVSALSLVMALAFRRPARRAS
ncbi:MAG: DUF3325 domain-containing protein [Alphaproteobacteria bacterium]|tara:strand:+ start:4636 stop:4917 length:282 start_codon:yes stop_codon:yes gene_type:complete